MIDSWSERAEGEGGDQGEKLKWFSPQSNFLWCFRNEYMEAREEPTHGVVSWVTAEEWILGREARAAQWGLVATALVFDRGGIIAFPVTPEERRARFLLC